jgi:predicted HTH transcriptional regulator
VPLSGLRHDAITREDLQALVDNGVREQRRIEFKLSVGGSDDDKREFLGDVSSFANASGGDLLVGVDAEDGVATRLAGIPNADVDGEILRLEKHHP